VLFSAVPPQSSPKQNMAVNAFFGPGLYRDVEA
jgi:hypothetical protein